MFHFSMQHNHEERIILEVILEIIQIEQKQIQMITGNLH